MDPNQPTPGGLDRDLLRASLVTKIFGRAPASVKVGHYRLLEEIGVGGMGQVFSAYDEVLDRKVAIKVVHEGLSSDAAKIRLRRQAQALGRLTHPNVVAVHEIGEHHGRIFVAMEFVRGQTLRAWQASQPRTIPQILAVYAQAARGLQAAHEAGLLHRDFKPDNVLLGEDGRVRVVDFGLARNLEDTDIDNERAETLPPDAEALRTPLTQTGSVLGTPTYMAPEQFRGEVTDARTDQFAWCIALWEALYGERPFVGSGYRELADNVVAGARRPVPRDSRVPGQLRAMLETGLRRAPSERHADLASAVQIVERQLTRRRPKWWRATLVVPVVGVTALAVSWDPAPASLEDCAPAEQRLAGVWDPTVRERLATRFGSSTDPDFVASTGASIERELDEVVRQWRASYADACEAVASTTAAERRLAARRLSCLDQALPRLSVFVEAIERLPAREVATSWRLEVGDRLAMRCEVDAVVRLLPPPRQAAVIDPGGMGIAELATSFVDARVEAAR